MRNRIGSIWITMFILLFISGCQKEQSRGEVFVQEQTETNEQEVTEEVEQTEQQVSEEAPTEEEVQVENQKKDVVSDQTPEIRISEKNYYDAENSEYINGRYPNVVVMGDSFELLKKAVEEWFSTYQDNYMRMIAENIQEAKIQAEDMGADFYPYYMDYDAYVVRADQYVSSIMLEETTFLGGAHGYEFLYGVTFDSKTGTELSFSDLGEIREDVRNYLDAQIQAKRAEGGSFELYEENVDSILDNPSWYLDGLGLNIIFNAYDIGSYAEGRTIITIPYEDMAAFNPDYIVTEE